MGKISMKFITVRTILKAKRIITAIFANVGEILSYIKRIKEAIKAISITILKVLHKLGLENIKLNDDKTE